MRGIKAVIGLGAALLIAVVGMADGAPAAAQGVTVLHYDLGETTIIQDQFPPESRFHAMPVRVRGVLALPAGAGPFPVVLIVHGSYQFCTAPLVNDVDPYPCPPEADLRQYEGFAELAAALADDGYLALVPDLSAEFNNGFGEPRFGDRAVQILTAHLDALAAGGGFDVDLADRADLNRLILVGHSRGGPLSIRFATDSAAASTYPLSALALLTPSAPLQGMDMPETLPAALVIAECDGDVGTTEPLGYLDEQLLPLRPGVTVISPLPGGTHNGFSTRLPPDPVDPCPGQALLEPARQRAIMARLLPRFFDLALNGG